MNRISLLTFVMFMIGFASCKHKEVVHSLQGEYVRTDDSKRLAYWLPEIENINPIYGPNRTGDISHSLANIEKAKKYLDYMPSYTFYRGLEETIKWYWNEYGYKR